MKMILALLVMAWLEVGSRLGADTGELGAGVARLGAGAEGGSIGGGVGQRLRRVPRELRGGEGDSGVGLVGVEQTRKAVMQSEASLKRARRMRCYCTIESPVKGASIDRRVDIGQMVGAGLNAASLFLIAKALKRMHAWVAVNEADLGQVQPGQAVAFTLRGVGPSRRGALIIGA